MCIGLTEFDGAHTALYIYIDTVFVLDKKLGSAYYEDCPHGCDTKAIKAIFNCIDAKTDEEFSKCVFDQIPKGSECYDCLCETIFQASGYNICDKVQSLGFPATVEEVNNVGCLVGSQCGTCPCCVGKHNLDKCC